MKNNFIAPPPACGSRAVSKAKKLAAISLGAVMAFSLIACAGNTHAAHDWSTTYTPDGNQHYQTCSGCDEKKYDDHDYGTSGTCVCGKTETDGHTAHDWSKTYTIEGNQHYQTCSGCDEKKYGDHDYGTSGVCVCGKTETEAPVVATGVTLDKSNIELIVGGTSAKLTATVSPANATDKTVTYSVEPAGIVSVDNDGNVTALTAGTTVITATTANGKTATCNVTVNVAIKNVQDLIANYGAEVKTAIIENYYDNVVEQTIAANMVNFDENKIADMTWKLSTDLNGNITKINLLTYYENRSTSISILSSIELLEPIFIEDMTKKNIKDLFESSSSSATYNMEFSFTFNPTIQYTRAALTNAICDKVFGENEGATSFIIDNGPGVNSTLGEYRQFTVVEICEESIKEISINIKSSSSDTEYINKLSNTSNYSTYDEQSYDISGVKVVA